MPRWMRALLIAAAATLAAGLVLNVLPGWREVTRGPAGDDALRARSPEDVIDELSDEEKARLLRELGQHV